MESRYARVSHERDPSLQRGDRARSAVSFIRPRRLARPRTPAFHVGDTGSNPVGDAHLLPSPSPLPLPIGWLPLRQAEARAGAGLVARNLRGCVYAIEKVLLSSNDAPFLGESDAQSLCWLGPTRERKASKTPPIRPLQHHRISRRAAGQHVMSVATLPLRLRPSRNGSQYTGR